MTIIISLVSFAFGVFVGMYLIAFFAVVEPNKMIAVIKKHRDDPA